MRIQFGCVAVLLAATLSPNAEAASVGFAGQVLTTNAGGGAGSAYGNVTAGSPIAYSTVELNFQDGAASGNLLVAGAFTSHPNIAIVSGSLQLTEAGTADTAVISLNISRDGGPTDSAISMTMTGDLFASAVINQATILSLVASADNDSSFTYIDNSGGQNSVYSGNGAAFTAVPEPGSIGALLGIGAICLARRRRRA